MRFFLGLTFLLLSHTDYGGRRMIMRQMQIYLRQDPVARIEYKPPGTINKNRRRLFAWAFLMVVIDNPTLPGMFLLVNLAFFCLMLARLLVHWFG